MNDPTPRRSLFAVWRMTWALCAACLLCGCGEMRQVPRPLSKTATLELFAVSPTNNPGSKQVAEPGTNAALCLIMPPIITATDVETVHRSHDRSGTESLTVRLTPTGASKMAAATANSRVAQVAILINGTVVAAPQVLQPLSGEIVITGGEFQKHGDSLFDALTKE